MARRNRIRIESNAQIKRVIMRPGSGTRAQFQGRGNLAAKYFHENIRKLAFQYENPAYPFDRHRNQISIRQARTNVVVTSNVITITANAPSAPFVEEGNDPGGGRKIRSPHGNFLALPFKAGFRVFLIKEVRPSSIDFHRPLLRAVIKAFKK